MVDQSDKVLMSFFPEKKAAGGDTFLVGDIPIFYFCMNFLSTKIVGFV